MRSCLGLSQLPLQPFSKNEAGCLVGRARAARGADGSDRQMSDRLHIGYTPLARRNCSRREAATGRLPTLIYHLTPPAALPSLPSLPSLPLGHIGHAVGHRDAENK